MPLKDILVHTDNSRNSEVRLEYATRLAETHEAYLTGLYVAASSPESVPSIRQAPNYIVPDLGGASLRDYEKKASELQSQYNDHARLAAEGAKYRFKEASKERSVSNQWTYTQESMIDALTHHARFCDVAVVGQPGPDSRRYFGESPTDHLILSVGHPVLVVPTLAEGFSVGKRIMIAWDRSPLATRAVHNSRPFLRHADSVHILTINLKPEKQGEKPGSGICEHLARHDIEAKPIRLTSKADHLYDVILAEAEELDIDLIIMGAYGHSRLREQILGGNTYHLLNHSPIPMLMSH
jgi:nucleotide-binding universal stress UspA family protein